MEEKNQLSPPTLGASLPHAGVLGGMSGAGRPALQELKARGEAGDHFVSLRPDAAGL